MYQMFIAPEYPVMAIWEYSPTRQYQMLIHGEPEDWSEENLLESLPKTKGRLNKLQEILLYAEANLGLFVDLQPSKPEGD